jgi:hypothetical protein
MMSGGVLCLLAIRRQSAAAAYLFVFLVLTVFLHHYVAGADLDDDIGVVVQNEQAVEGDEERAILVVATGCSLLIGRGLEPRAPPSSIVSA